MTKYLLGIDAGNTLVKAALFDLEGKEIAVERRDGGTRQPHPGHVERDIEELRVCAAQAIHGCLTRAGVPAADIAAVGCAGHGNGLYLLDGAGRGIVGIQSLDTRAADLVDYWRSNGTGAGIYDLSFQIPWASQSATLLGWFRRSAEDVFRQTANVLCCKDVITHFLTGHIGTDYSDASGGGLLNIRSRDYDDALLDLLGLSDARTKLPSLAEPTDVVGHVTEDAARATGLQEGTPVVAGLFDVVASALGSGVAEPGGASIVAGTWSINQVVTGEPLHDPAVLMAATFRADRYMEIEASATSATNLEWFLHEIMADILAARGRKATFDLCNDLVRAVELRADLPIYHPYLYGSPVDSRARAGFFGVAGWHDRGQLIHAVMEGVTFGHRQHVEKLRGTGANIRTARLSGGAARSAEWAQIFADVLQIEIDTVCVGETGALGAAMAAGIGVGIYRDFEAAASIVRPQSRFVPVEAESGVRDARYQTFCELSDAVRKPWERLAHAR